MQATSKGSDQTASIPRLVKHLLVAQITTLFEISCRGSIIGMCVFYGHNCFFSNIPTRVVQNDFTKDCIYCVKVETIARI